MDTLPTAAHRTRRTTAAPGSPVLAALGPADLPDIGRLFRDHTGRPADLATIGTWLDGWPCSGARLDGALVGCLLCRSFAPDLGEIATFLVAPAARDRGIGTALVRHVEDAATQQGLQGLIGVTSLGYRVVGEKRLSSPLFVRLGYRIVLETADSQVFARTLPRPHP